MYLNRIKGEPDNTFANRGIGYTSIYIDNYTTILYEPRCLWVHNAMERGFYLKVGASEKSRDNG